MRVFCAVEAHDVFVSYHRMLDVRRLRESFVWLVGYSRSMYGKASSNILIFLGIFPCCCHAPITSTPRHSRCWVQYWLLRVCQLVIITMKYLTLLN